MSTVALHHVSVLATDLARSVDFYTRLFDLQPIDRPPFATSGAWLACGRLQVHINVYPSGTFRRRGIDRDDGHFAFRTDDFEAFVKRITANGFREDAGEDDPQRMIIVRQGIAGFPQVYVTDPDRNIIEVNGAP
jgi:catechol 2,3-dioxygenase-like lactoylglutathione lyase family enzyme